MSSCLAVRRWAVLSGRDEGDEAARGWTGGLERSLGLVGREGVEIRK